MLYTDCRESYSHQYPLFISLLLIYFGCYNLNRFRFEQDALRELDLNAELTRGDSWQSQLELLENVLHSDQSHCRLLFTLAAG